MNCRTVRMMAIAIAVCFLAATVQTATAAMDFPHGWVVAVNLPVPAAGKDPGVPGSIQILGVDQQQHTYPLADKITVLIPKEAAGDLTSGVKLDDWIGCVVEDGKVTVITNMLQIKKPK